MSPELAAVSARLRSLCRLAPSGQHSKGRAITPRLLAGAPLQEIDPKEIVQEEEKSDLDQHVHRSSVCESQRLEGTQRLSLWGQQPALADTHFSLPTGGHDFGQVPPAPANLSLLLSIPGEPRE